jgi:hypothetical protein
VIAASASRAEAPPNKAQLIGLPRLGTVVRAAVSDYYFNSMRLVPANLVWGFALALIVLIGMVSPLLSLTLLPLLALPTAGVFRIAARIVVAFVALVACRSVYPAADRLEPALRGERP